ncbi:MAG: response regulator [candidate division WOR-3 bacterium]
MPIRVLLVDDEEDILWGLSEELARNQIEVDTATNGLEALEKIKKKQYDFLVTDIRMPGLSGSELLMETKKIQPDIKVIVMTAYGSDEVKQDVLTKGAISYLEKPFDFDQILNVIIEKQTAEDETLKNLSLHQFLQLVSMEGKSCEVIVNTSEGEGKIFFEEGEVINASIGKLRGEEAFNRILKEPESSFRVKWGSPKVKREIEKPFHALLLSVAVKKDEEALTKEELTGLDLESLSELFRDEGVEEGETKELAEEPYKENFQVSLEEEIEVPIQEEITESAKEEFIIPEQKMPSVTLEEVERLLEGIGEKEEVSEEVSKGEEAKVETVEETKVEREPIMEKVVAESKPVEEQRTPSQPTLASKLSQELKEKFSSVVKEISDILALIAIDSEGNIINAAERISTGVTQVLRIWAPALKNILQSAGKTSIGSIKDITLTSDKYHLLITDARNSSLLIVAVIPVKSMKIALVKIKIKELINEIAKVV